MLKYQSLARWVVTPESHRGLENSQDMAPLQFRRTARRCYRGKFRTPVLVPVAVLEPKQDADAAAVPTMIPASLRRQDCVRR